MPNVWEKLLHIGTAVLDPKAQMLRRLLNEDNTILVTGMIIQDVLHGIKNSAEKEKVWQLLEQMEYVEFTKNDYYQASFYLDNDLFLNLHRTLAARLKAEIVD